MELYGTCASCGAGGRDGAQRARWLLSLASLGTQCEKMLRYSVPPGYQRQQPVKRAKAGAVDWRDRRHSGRTTGSGQPSSGTLRSGFWIVFEKNTGSSGGYTIVKDYVRTATLRGREMFVPLMASCG